MYTLQSITFVLDHIPHGPRQSARLAYLSGKIEIGRDWYTSQIGRRFMGKSENVYSGTRTFCLFSRPISIFQLK